jgi:hypothetical protein
MGQGVGRPGDGEGASGGLATVRARAPIGKIVSVSGPYSPPNARPCINLSAMRATGATIPTEA